MAAKDRPKLTETKPTLGTSGIAEELFLEERPFVLSPEAQRVLFEALISPPKVKPALRKLMRGTDSSET